MHTFARTKFAPTSRRNYTRQFCFLRIGGIPNLRRITAALTECDRGLLTINMFAVRDLSHLNAVRHFFVNHAVVSHAKTETPAQIPAQRIAGIGIFRFGSDADDNIARQPPQIFIDRCPVINGAQLSDSEPFAKFVACN